MNKVYIFKINNTFSILNKYNTYNLFVLLSGLVNTSEFDLIKAKTLYDSITEKLEISDINLLKMLDNDNYIINNNIHYYNDYFSKEKSKLIVHNNYISLYSNKETSIFFNSISNIKNMFYINFRKKEYGWLSKSCNKWENLI